MTTGFDRCKGSEHWKRFSGLTVLLKYLRGLRQIAGFTWTIHCTASSVWLIGSTVLEPRNIKYSSCFWLRVSPLLPAFHCCEVGHNFTQLCHTDLPLLLYLLPQDSLLCLTSQVPASFVQRVLSCQMSLCSLIQAVSKIRQLD